MKMQRRYNYNKSKRRTETIIEVVCARCSENFIVIKVGGNHKKYCEPCRPLAERERHTRGEAERRERAKRLGHEFKKASKPKLIRYAGYDGRGS